MYIQGSCFYLYNNTVNWILYISEKEIKEEIVCGSPSTVNVDFKVSEEEVTLATIPGTYQCKDNKILKLEKEQKTI